MQLWRLVVQVLDPLPDIGQPRDRHLSSLCIGRHAGWDGEVGRHPLAPLGQRCAWYLRWHTLTVVLWCRWPDLLIDHNNRGDF